MDFLCCAHFRGGIPLRVVLGAVAMRLRLSGMSGSSVAQSKRSAPSPQVLWPSIHAVYRRFVSLLLSAVWTLCQRTYEGVRNRTFRNYQTSQRPNKEHTTVGSMQILTDLCCCCVCSMRIYLTAGQTVQRLYNLASENRCGGIELSQFRSVRSETWYVYSYSYEVLCGECFIMIGWRYPVGILS